MTFGENVAIFWVSGSVIKLRKWNQVGCYMFIMADTGIRLRQGDGKLEDSLVRTCLMKGEAEGLKGNWNKRG